MTSKLVSFIKETARQKNLGSFEYLLEKKIEKIKGGGGADIRGAVSEHAFHLSSLEYMKKKKEAINLKMSDNEAHEYASNYLRTGEHFKNVKNAISKMPKIKAFGGLNDDLHHTIEDCSHATADWLHHIHKHIGSIDHDSEVHLTGPIGEKKVADVVGGYTNADLVIGVKDHKNGKKTKVALDLGGDDKTGNSLKYSTSKAKGIKIRTPGINVFNRHINNLANNVYTRLRFISKSPNVSSEKSKRARESYEKIESASGESGLTTRYNMSSKRINTRRLRLSSSWEKDYSDTHGKDKLDDLKNLLSIRHPGATINTYSDTASGLRKIIRNKGETMPKGQKIDILPHNSEHIQRAIEHERNLKNLKSSSLGNASSESSDRAVQLLNHIYRTANDFNDRDINRHVNNFHRILTGTFARRTRFAKIGGKRVPIIRTHLVVVKRTTRGERPETKIHSPTNRLEELSRTSGRWEARSSEGRKGFSIDHNSENGRDNVMNLSTDDAKGDMNVQFHPERNILQK